MAGRLLPHLQPRGGAGLGTSTTVRDANRTTQRDVGRCGGGTWREHTARLGGASERARELGVRAEQNSRVGGERGGETLKRSEFVGGALDGGTTCGIVAEGTRRRRRRKTRTRRAAATVRVEDAGEGRGLPPPSPATGPHAGGGRSRGARRQGETIAKGHKNYELMLNLQLGIRVRGSRTRRPAPRPARLEGQKAAGRAAGGVAPPRAAAHGRVVFWRRPGGASGLGRREAGGRGAPRGGASAVGTREQEADGQDASAEQAAARREAGRRRVGAAAACCGRRREGQGGGGVASGGRGIGRRSCPPRHSSRALALFSLLLGLP
ncbi:hypothetical protein E2562_023243 [Oryza meyeriana var. granulata]|uniref:Uncharacterized protein n=1 Tax=Oryza meyeriana var. granulata TaxID=110450 RepID=A0A6G1DM29_9ORYZ|nr:hypothetical protein E2562_023243 [Oryza meyeriana var. granulata]